MITKKFVTQIINLAKGEAAKSGAPSQVHLDISLTQGKRLAQQLKADENLVALGICFMDIKLGEAMQANQLAQHVTMSLAYTIDVLGPNPELTDQEKSVVYNAIESHHGAVPHTSLASEIVTAADCYRFLHPAGIMEFLRILSHRLVDLPAIVDQAEAKLNEKWGLVTLPTVKTELKPYYQQFKSIFAATRRFYQR